MLADKFLKEGEFEKARQEVSKAQKLDPSNPYAYAFLDRIAHFEEQRKRESPAPPPVAAPQPPPAPPAGKPVAAPPARQEPPVTPKQGTPPAPRVTPPSHIDSKLEEMKRQIEMLTKALDSERKVREEMNQQQLKGAIKQLRSAMEKAWMNGAPKDQELVELHELAVSVGIPEDVEHTLKREVKLDMYSRAVKEVVAKQKLLRNSSRTLEWLRKVYQVTMDEYLEYESKFLLDLVADQYRGTILFVSPEDKETKDLAQKLKASGYAVVTATSPEHALEKIEKINPHFVLCSMEFSGGHLSGIKFLHVLRANSKFSYIPFILICEQSGIVQLKSSELRPTEGYVEKPVDFESLNEVMNEKLIVFRQYLSSI